MFDEMKGIVTVDEKWFYKYEQGQKYYLCGDDVPRSSSAASLGCHQKPQLRRHDWHLLVHEAGAGQRNSRNMDAGTMETYMVEVTKEVNKLKMVGEAFAQARVAWGARGRSGTAGQRAGPPHQ